MLTDMHIINEESLYICESYKKINRDVISNIVEFRLDNLEKVGLVNVSNIGLTASFLYSI